MNTRLDLYSTMVCVCRTACCRLTEQALERCQVKRRHTGAQHAPLAVELAAVASHLEAWQGTWLQENGALLVWALQGTSDPSR